MDMYVQNAVMQEAHSTWSQHGGQHIHCPTATVLTCAALPNDRVACFRAHAGFAFAAGPFLAGSPEGATSAAGCWPLSCTAYGQ